MFLKENKERTMLGMLYQESRLTFMLSIVLAVFAGVANVTIIPLVFYLVEAGAENNIVGQVNADLSWLPFHLSFPAIFLLFAIYCLIIIVIRSSGQIILAKLAVHSTMNLRNTLYRRIASASTADIEKIGPSKIITALNVDVQRVSDGMGELPNLIVTIATIAGLLAYLAFISVGMAIIAFMVILFGVITSRLPFSYARKRLRKSRHIIDSLQESVRGLIYGHNELKNRAIAKRNYMSSELFGPESAMARKNIEAQSIMILAMNYGGMIAFFVIGVFAFFSSSVFSLGVYETTATIMVMMYVSAPLGKLVSLFRPIANANVSLEKISTLFDMMPKERVSLIDSKMEIRNPRIKSIKLKGVKRSYKTDEESDDVFEVGPVDVDFHAGELTFIVGGNGSGKTSLAKIISLHYRQDDGELYFNNTLITHRNLEDYRQTVSAIYANYYLFEKLYAFEDEDVQDEVQKLIEDLHLGGKVKFENGRFSTLSLSSGQRRRLALLSSYLEARDVYVFDEWSADQDPKYREIFYKEFLPALVAKSKIVIVISHDDRYYHMADKLIVMESGKIREICESNEIKKKLMVS